jgi:hypothetical protein
MRLTPLPRREVGVQRTRKDDGTAGSLDRSHAHSTSLSLSLDDMGSVVPGHLPWERGEQGANQLKFGARSREQLDPTSWVCQKTDKLGWD